MRTSLAFACVLAVVGALALVLLGAEPAPALAHPVGPDAAYTVHVEDEGGSALRSFHKDGHTFVLGTYGQRYRVRIRNQTARRVEAVVTVDGRDVVSGRVGDFVGERGYVIEPYDTLRIEGFRRNIHEVAAFRFSSPRQSYSARMGTPENVGVIGVAFFPERPRPARRPHPHIAHPYEEDGARYDARPAPRAESRKSAGGAMGTGAGEASSDLGEASGSYRAQAAPAAPAQADRVNRLGTEYGESHESHVQEVAFRRADVRQPAELITLRYDDEQGLLARGIRLSAAPEHASCEEPLAFPRNRFAPPPP